LKAGRSAVALLAFSTNDAVWVSIQVDISEDVDRAARALHAVGQEDRESVPYGILGH
jgi:hypothetical protein